ncbi:penicillin-binding protein [Rhodococcus hoagii]|uniref:Penicillin-binding protein, transpeptidase domain protein n=1 Tax=Prescottella equi ATCC 33707 TaxID=525370 RepID=E9T7L3_RHOHA|nr:penicillin-binding transpeptidase domain-containing protein [Prescottella equi]EGD21713.1 penicillin-binding protein, transpeptidase domain protein [Prescottella equi ATCC 33707]MBM4526066.1 penicillin-binding protein [Prescottella equi]MBM4639307.1 penicillin-binding protein [Prescottella equi]MBM4651840.1 penicillin-binding protein [Prescottella equi]MBM4668974.1 penicillin-binding protein [Prescottella equi]
MSVSRPGPRTTATVLAVASALVLSGCGGGDPSPEQRFADALASGDVQAAADLTSDPAAASTAITAMLDGLNAQGRSFSVSENGDAFTLAADWSFGDGKQWQYSTEGRVDGDVIAWDPAVLAPGLAAGSTVRFTPTSGTPAEVRASDGQPIMTQQVVTLVDVQAPADTAALARLLNPIVPTITAESLGADLGKSDGKPITAVALREQDVEPVRDQLAAVPGVELVQQTRLLTVDRALSSPVLADLTTVWQEQQDESAGWAVQLVNADGTARRLAGQDAAPVPDIDTTLDLRLQTRAEDALASVPQPAAIVALRPSTGAVLAVAQNAPADAQGAIALTGLYPPGSTFKTVTTSAALQAGKVTPDTVLPCPGTENIEGRQIPNDDNFDLGSVPLHSAFAHSCNTTMGRLAVSLPPDALQQAALQFGLGVDYVTPGLTTVTGTVPTAQTPAERVESAIGQGAVTASPFGMALVAASIANGTTPAPTMIVGKPGVADRSVTPTPADVDAALRSMMRETVTDGTARTLADLPNLEGKTGTAEYGEGTRPHGWFVGMDGDLAFAVFVAGADSSGPALEAAGRFLR